MSLSSFLSRFNVVFNVFSGSNGEQISKYSKLCRQNQQLSTIKQVFIPTKLNIRGALTENYITPFINKVLVVDEDFMMCKKLTYY